MAVRKIKNSWWIDFRHNHTRYRKRSPENSKAGAEAYEAAIRQKLARGESLDVDRKQTFKAFAWKWFDTYVLTNNKPYEIGNKKYTLRSHLIPFFGECPAGEISSFQVEQYKAEKIKSGLKNKTINNHLTILAKCLRDAQEWLGFEKLPKIKKLNVPPQETVFLSEDESRLLLANLDGPWHDFILMALKTGLRRGELKALNWTDIDWQNRTLSVVHSWCEPSKELVSPKSNRIRHIPLTDEVYKMLWERKKPYGPIFSNTNGRRINVRKMNKEISAACKRAGITEISCHKLRHTFASHLIKVGASIKATQELLGHANITTTMRYSHLAPSVLKDTVALLEPKEPTLGQQVGNARQ
jgi:integrase